jgi:hypothetical protein
MAMSDSPEDSLQSMPMQARKAADSVPFSVNGTVRGWLSVITRA